MIITIDVEFYGRYVYRSAHLDISICTNRYTYPLISVCVSSQRCIYNFEVRVKLQLEKFFLLFQTKMKDFKLDL